MVVEYVVMAVLSLHRNLHVYIDQQRRCLWSEVIPQAQSADRRVSVLGMGVLGQAALAKLQDFGFKLSAWSRSARSIDGVECFRGQHGLYEMLATTDILVCRACRKLCSPRILFLINPVMTKFYRFHRRFVH